MAEEFCRRALGAIEQLFVPRVQAGTRVLDLCCGSGQMARALTGHGFRVTGIDASDQMLRLARANAPEAEFVLADARSFQLPPVYGGALCTFNSLAHFGTAPELTGVFRNVHNALVPGAPFLFDLSMEEAYTSKWRGSFALVGEEYACMVRPSYDPQRHLGRNEVTVFRRDGVSHGSPAWNRFDFCIEQQCHTEQALREALAAAGFASVQMYDAQRDLGIPGEWGRMFCLCN